MDKSKRDDCRQEHNVFRQNNLVIPLLTKHAKPQSSFNSQNLSYSNTKKSLGFELELLDRMKKKIVYTTPVLIYYVVGASLPMLSNGSIKRRIGLFSTLEVGFIILLNKIWLTWYSFNYLSMRNNKNGVKCTG